VLGIVALPPLTIAAGVKRLGTFRILAAVTGVCYGGVGLATGIIGGVGLLPPAVLLLLAAVYPRPGAPLLVTYATLAG
jgi:hypothetical protein